MNLIRLVRWRSLCANPASGTVLELAGGWVSALRFVPEACPLWGASGSVRGRWFVLNRRGWHWIDLGNPRGVRLTLSLGWFALTIGRPREDRYRTVQILP